MLIRDKYLKEALKRIEKEKREKLKGIEYMIGDNIYIQYDNIYNLIKIREPELEYYIYEHEFNYNNLELLPSYLKELEFDIN